MMIVTTGIVTTGLTIALIAANPDPTNRLMDYGVIGIFAVILIYVVKKLDDRNTTNYELRLKDKDKQIELKDDMIDRLQSALSNHVVPSMNKQAEVMENMPSKETAILEMMSKMESEMQSIAGRVESALASIPEGERE